MSIVLRDVGSSGTMFAVSGAFTSVFGVNKVNLDG